MKKISILGFLIFINMALSSCSDPNKNTFQGYIEGEYSYLATSSSGKLAKVLTERGKTVNSGDELFELENQYERYGLQQAEQELISATAQLQDMEIGERPEELAVVQAQLNQAKAEAANYLALLNRNERLFKQGSISRQDLDDSRTNAISSSAKVDELTSQLETANLPQRENLIKSQQATVKSAEAAVAKAQWELDQRKISAPTNGLIYDVLFRQGEWVTAGSPVIQMLSTDNVKIRFFVPEPLIGKIRLGEKAKVSVDGRAEPLQATISYVAGDAEYTPPIIYSNETRSKLVFMVEAKPDPSIALSLHPGQPVSVSLP